MGMKNEFAGFTLKRTAALLLVLALATGLMTACGNGSANRTAEPSGSEQPGAGQAGTEQPGAEADQDVEITFAWWGTTVHNERYQQIIDLFERKYPHIKINPQYADYNGNWEKLAVQAGGNSLPELIQMDFPKLNEWVSRGLLRPLDAYVDEKVIDLEGVNRFLLDGGKVDDKLYAVSVGSNTPAMIYDPAMLAEAGVEPLEPGYTWEELIDKARELKEKLGEGKYFTPADGLLGFYHYVRQTGQWFYNGENDGLGFDDQTLIDFLSLWTPLREEGVTPPANVAIAVKNNEDRLLIKGESPVDFMFDAQTQAIQQLSGRPLELTVYPTLPGGEKGLYLKPSVMLSVTSNADDAEAKAAAQFIEFFTASEEANLILLGIRGAPIHAETRDMLYPQLDESVQKIFDYAQAAEDFIGPLYPAEPAGHSEVTALWDRLNEQLLFGQITPTEFAQRLREGVQKIFAK